MKLWILVGAAVAVVVVAVFQLDFVKDDKAHVLDLETGGPSGTEITGKLVTSGASGEIFTWIQMGRKTLCPRKVLLETSVEFNFKFTCGPVKDGNFKMRTHRKPPVWVRQHATSF